MGMSDRRCPENVFLLLCMTFTGGLSAPQLINGPLQNGKKPLMYFAPFERKRLCSPVMSYTSYTKAMTSKTAQITSANYRLGPRAEEILADRHGGIPVWIRPPKRGVEFYTGMSRAKLYEGATKGHFRSVSIREPGQTKGTRLFHLGSILNFIERCEVSTHVEPKKGADKHE